MASLPLKSIRTAYEQHNEFVRTHTEGGFHTKTQVWGRGWKALSIVLRDEDEGDIAILELYHYGTHIATASELGYVVKRDGAYSASDRDAINSLCELYGVKNRCRIVSGTLKMFYHNTEW